MALKILLADDSMTAQNMGKKILVDAGYEVVAVSNGAAAIKKISSERPDIAILDEYMPGYTGSEVCERVKGSAETSKIPVLLTVGKMEPFDQEKANKVRADGVMIKPFEASDLIAAIQSIAQRLLAPTSGPRPARDSSVPLSSNAKYYADTLRVPPPIPTEAKPEDTLRLTPEQIKAFQDASYRDWENTAERQSDDEGSPALPEPEEMSVTPSTEESPMRQPAAPGEPEIAAIPACVVEEESAAPIPDTPVFNAITASGVAAEHEIFTAAATPAAPIEEPIAFAAAVAFSTPAEIEPDEQVSTPAFSIESDTPTSAVASVNETTTEIPPVVEPVMEAMPEEAAAAVVPIFETNALLTPGPMMVPGASDLEPTIAPAVEIEAPQVRDLEINSPPQERSGPVIAQDPALVTESEDMTQFATKFGVESAEPVHVGVATDLPEEQLAAIVTPVEAVPVTEELPVMQIASSEEIVTATVEENIAPNADTPAESAVQAMTPVEAAPAIVVRDPSLDDTQPITPFTEPEETPVVSEAVTQGVVAEAAAEVDSVEPAVAAEESKQSGPAEPILPEAEVVSPAEAPEISPAMAGDSEAGPASETAKTGEPEPYVEEAVAAAAATAAGISVPHLFTAHVDPEGVGGLENIEDEIASSSVVQSATVGDAELAEQLAAAISKNETEECARDAADALAAAATESSVSSGVVPSVGIRPQGVSDSKLAEAVARAFEHLKPQLITEIIKELEK